MKYYTLNIHTQQGTISYTVKAPADIDLTDMLLSDEPAALETAEGSTLIVQCINAVAIEVVHTPPPQNS